MLGLQCERRRHQDCYCPAQPCSTRGLAAGPGGSWRELPLGPESVVGRMRRANDRWMKEQERLAQVAAAGRERLKASPTSTRTPLACSAMGHASSQ